MLHDGPRGGLCHRQAGPRHHICSGASRGPCRPCWSAACSRPKFCSDRHRRGSCCWPPLSPCLPGQATCHAGTDLHATQPTIANIFSEYSALPAIQAMVATVEAYAADEAAQRIIPAVAPLGVDPVPEVRQSALAALDAFMRLLREHSTQLESAATATGSAAGDAAQVTLPGLAPRLGWPVCCLLGSPTADGLAPSAVAACEAGPLRCRDCSSLRRDCWDHQGLRARAAPTQ